MSILNADRRPLVDRVLGDSPSTGLMDGARTAGCFNDLGNCSHAQIDTELNSVFQASNALPRNYFQDYATPMDWKQRLNETFAETGWSKAELGRRADVSYDNVIKYLAGAVDQPRGDTLKKLATALEVDPLWLEKGIDPAGEVTSTVPLMGFVGAGGEIDPDFEQIPPDGLDQIIVPFSLPGDMIALQVKGVSMLPRYDPDDVLIVWREQRRALHTFYGEEAAVRTTEGRRYLKVIQKSGDAIDLISWNDHPLRDVRLEWIGEIYSTIRASQLRRVASHVAKQGGLQGQLKLKSA